MATSSSWKFLYPYTYSWRCRMIRQMSLKLMSPDGLNKRPLFRTSLTTPSRTSSTMPASVTRSALASGPTHRMAPMGSPASKYTTPATELGAAVRFARFGTGFSQGPASVQSQHRVPPASLHRHLIHQVRSPPLSPTLCKPHPRHSLPRWRQRPWQPCKPPPTPHSAPTTCCPEVEDAGPYNLALHHGSTPPP